MTIESREDAKLKASFFASSEVVKESLRGREARRDGKMGETSNGF